MRAVRVQPRRVRTACVRLQTATVLKYCVTAVALIDLDRVLGLEKWVPGLDNPGQRRGRILQYERSRDGTSSSVYVSDQHQNKYKY